MFTHTITTMRILLAALAAVVLSVDCLQAVPIDHFSGLLLDAPLVEQIQSGRALELAGVVADELVTEILFSFSPESGGADVDFFISHLEDGRFRRSVVFAHNQTGTYALAFYAGQREHPLPFVGRFAPFVVEAGSGPIELPGRFFDGLLMDAPLTTEYQVGRVVPFSGVLEDDTIRALSLTLTGASGGDVRETRVALEGRRFHLPLRFSPDEVGEELDFTVIAQLADGFFWDRGSFVVRLTDPPSPQLEVGVLALGLLSGTTEFVPLVNQGDVDLTVLEVYVDGPFEIADAPVVVEAGSAAVVAVSYDGAGGAQGALVLRTDDPRRPEVSVALAGLAASAMPVGFERIQASDEGTLVLELDLAANDYVLALSSGQVYDVDSKASYGFTAGGPSTLAKPVTPVVLSPRDAFEAALRRREAELAERVRTQGLPLAKRAAVTYQTGDQRNFAFESGSVSARTLTATVVHVNDRAVAFLDNALRPHGDNVTASEIAGFVDVFAADYDLLVAAFGAPSDVDGDGKIAFLFSHLVDDAGPAGFFEAESAIGPDLGGNGNVTDLLFISPTTTRRAYRSLLAHEFQHLISFNQHVFVRFGEAEVSWLNEGLSHVAEDLVDGHVQGDVSGLVQTFLANPSRVGLRGDANNDSGLRGAAYLFVRSLVDRLGQQMLLRLVQTGLADRDNIETATGEKFEDLLAFWAAQLYASGNGLIDHSRLNYSFPMLRVGEDRGFRMPATLTYQLSGPAVSGVLQPRGVNFLRLIGDSEATILIDTDAAGLLGAVVLPLSKGFIADVRIPGDYFPGMALDPPLPAVFQTGEALLIRGTLDIEQPAQIALDFTPKFGGETLGFFILVEGGVFERAIVFDHSKAGTYELEVYAGPDGDRLPFSAGFSPVEILPGSGAVRLPPAYFNGVRLAEPLPTMLGIDTATELRGTLSTSEPSIVLFRFVPEQDGEPLEFVFDAGDGTFEGVLDFDIADRGTYRLEVYVGPAGQELTFTGASKIEVGESAITAVVEEDDILPGSFALTQNFPNPFNGRTAIQFSIPDRAAGAEALLAVFDLLGQPVATLAQGPLSPGKHAVRWDGRDASGRELASGVYLYRLTFGQEVLTRKLLLLR